MPISTKKHFPTLRWVLPLAAISAVTQPAQAIQYFSVDAVKHALFPQAKSFTELTLLLTSEQRKSISARVNVRVRDVQLKIWEARNEQAEIIGYIFIDEVTGKHDLITFALAVSRQGKIIGLEIMDYRELYGERVRDERWRTQFLGKSSHDPLVLDTDIHNISGATLSCGHVTQGVRRLLASFEIAVLPFISK